MNSTQRKILTYLADPGRSNSDEAMEDLVGLGVFKSQTDNETLSTLDQYLTDNKRNYCKAGIQRARIAFDLPEKKKFKVGDTVTQKDFRQLKPGSGLFAKGKMHMVVNDGVIVSQVDGKEPSYASTAEFEIKYLAA